MFFVLWRRAQIASLSMLANAQRSFASRTACVDIDCLKRTESHASPDSIAEIDPILHGSF